MGWGGSCAKGHEKRRRRGSSSGLGWAGLGSFPCWRTEVARPSLAKMDWNEVVASQALKVLCASGGCLAEGELIRRLRCQSSPDRLAPLLQDTKRFTVVTREEAPSAAPGTGGGDDSRVVVATTGARLCREHRGGKCAGGCRQLHLCSYFVYGGCRLQGTG